MASPCKVQDDVAGNKPEWHTLLLNELAHPNTLTPALSDLIAGPSYLTSTSFSSTFSSLAYHPRYWVHTQHPESPVVLRFPAVLHVGGKHGKTAPYFNKRNEKNDTQIKVDKMKDMKAIFELVGMWEHDVKGEVVRKEPLVKKEQVGEEGVGKEGEKGEKSASPYPDEVLKCSKRAFDFLHIITQRLEIESNKGLDVSGGTPAHHGFFRHYFNRENELARSSFYVSSYKFFVDVEDASTIDVDLPPDLEVDLTTRKMSELLEDEGK
ncbi:hypothetical protein CPC08DRAFT_126314 [Agrocybe pediades]|nr:hypothetical protein CPC08DRAFT_126314 [Agrocybe pediades]